MNSKLSREEKLNAIIAEYDKAQAEKKALAAKQIVIKEKEAKLAKIEEDYKTAREAVILEYADKI